MTLEELRNSRYEDLCLAVVKREIDWNDAEKVFLTIPGYDYEMSVINVLKISVEEVITERNIHNTEEYNPVVNI